jgi:hypothetical protein
MAIPPPEIPGSLPRLRADAAQWGGREEVTMSPVESQVRAVDEVSGPEPEPRGSHGRAWLAERVDGRLALGVGIAWLVLFQIAALLEPATTQSVPVVGVALEVVMWTLLATMVTGLVMQRRWGFVASLGAATFATAASIACPTTGHHPFGAWWFGQMLCVLGLVAVSLVALRSHPASRDRELSQ